MKQNGIRKQFLCVIFMICCIVAGLYTGRIGADAKVKDVTKSIPEKHNIRVISGYFRTLCGYDLIEREMNTSQQKKYDFSKESTRRYALSRCFSELYSQIYAGIDAKTLSRWIFGKSTTKVNFIEGDWGLSYPKIKIKKIYKRASGKYTVKADVDWIVENDNYGIEDSYQIGELKINFKKKPKSYYGYIVKSMALKKVSD